VGTTITNQEDGIHQGTPKRQRINETDNGSRSAPPRVPDNPDTQHGRQRAATDLDADARRLITGKDAMPETSAPMVVTPRTEPELCTSVTNLDASDSLLQPVHKEVINSLAANAASGSSSPVSPVLDLPLKKFVQTLATSGSDKSFLIQKKYKQLMDPIVEDLSEEGTQSGEKVDFGESDSEDTDNISSDSGSQQ
jgi:hypothetical protein